MVLMAVLVFLLHAPGYADRGGARRRLALSSFGARQPQSSAGALRPCGGRCRPAPRRLAAGELDGCSRAPAARAAGQHGRLDAR